MSHFYTCTDVCFVCDFLKSGFQHHHQSCHLNRCMHVYSRCVSVCVCVCVSQPAQWSCARGSSHLFETEIKVKPMNKRATWIKTEDANDSPSGECVRACVCVCVCVREKERESECLSEWESGSVVFAPHLFSTPSWLHLSLTEWVRAHTHTHTHTDFHALWGVWFSHALINSSFDTWLPNEERELF